MNSFGEGSRRDFLRRIPKYLARSVHTFTKELSKPTDADMQIAEGGTVGDSLAKIAEIDANYCLAWEGGSCQFCYLACPLKDKAIVVEDQKPIINPSICDGCARCVAACQTVNTILAIRVVAVK